VRAAARTPGCAGTEARIPGVQGPDFVSLCTRSAPARDVVTYGLRQHGPPAYRRVLPPG